jgi:hypothetical protein
MQDQSRAKLQKSKAPKHHWLQLLHQQLQSLSLLAQAVGSSQIPNNLAPATLLLMSYRGRVCSKLVPA